MGGGDESDNLVALIPEDHFFAHLLLAKEHGGRMWAPVKIMAAAALGRKSKHNTIVIGRDYKKMRTRYSRARRWANKYMTGDGHPSSDKALYLWRNINGNEELMTRVGLAKKYGFHSLMLNPVVSGKSMSVYGWYLVKNNPNGIIGPRTGIDHPQADQSVYLFRHVDGQEVCCTRQQLATQHKVHPASINAIVQGRCKTAHGWYLPELNPLGLIAHEFTDGLLNGFADKTLYCFKSIYGAVEVCTRIELCKKHGLSRGSLNCMISGKTQSCGGWFLEERNPLGLTAGDWHKREKNPLFCDKVFHFVNDNGIHESATMYDMHRKYGGPRPAWTKVAKQKKTYKGWRLIGNGNIKRSNKGKTYTFLNNSGAIFTGSQKEFGEAHGLSAPAVCRIVNQRATDY